MHDGSTGGEEPEWVQHERQTFKDQRDANGDGFLDADEVRDAAPTGRWRPQTIDRIIEDAGLFRTTVFKICILTEMSRKVLYITGLPVTSCQR